MHTLRAVLDTGARPNLIRSDFFSIGWRHNLVTLAHIPRLGDAKSRPMQLLSVVVLRLRLGNSHFRAPFIVTNHLAASMIIGTKFLDRHVHEIRCMEGIVEKTPGTVRILSSNKVTVVAAEADVSTPKKTC